MHLCSIGPFRCVYADPWRTLADINYLTRPLGENDEPSGVSGKCLRVGRPARQWCTAAQHAKVASGGGGGDGEMGSRLGKRRASASG